MKVMGVTTSLLLSGLLIFSYRNICPFERHPEYSIFFADNQNRELKKNVKESLSEFCEEESLIDSVAENLVDDPPPDEREKIINNFKVVPSVPQKIN